jgi:hypothetical protein
LPKHYIAEIMPLYLPDKEKLALIALLTCSMAEDRYRLSPRVRALKDILTELRHEPVRHRCHRPRCVRLREQQQPKDDDKKSKPAVSVED